MATIHGNFSFNPNPKCKDGDTFDDYNMTQAVADTEVCVGKKNLTFTEKGNKTNCKFPAGTTVEGPIIRKSFCSHLHPEWVSKGLPVCVLECEHMVKKYEFDEGAVTKDTFRKYEDKDL